MADTDRMYEFPSLPLSNDALLHVRNAAKITMNAGSSLDHLFLVSIQCSWIELICYIRFDTMAALRLW